jgi:glutathione S-transferase
MAILYALSYSPWSERARWMLLHHGCSFEERAHVPFLGEFALRRAAHRWTGRVSVPLLVDGTATVQDSLAIAHYIDARGTGTRLLPPELAHAIAELNGVAESVVDAFRGLGIQLVLQHPEFALAFMPAPLKNLPFAAAGSRVGSRLLARKYHVDMGGTRDRIRAGLDGMRAALGGRAYVHGRFTYADILIATSLSLMAPVSERFIALDPVLRRLWRDEELAREFGDLVSWRDQLYANHRPLPAANAAPAARSVREHEPE